MIVRTGKSFGFSLSYALGFMISSSIVLGLSLESPIFGITVTPFLFGSLGFLWTQPNPKRLYVGVLSSLFWTVFYSFFAGGVLAWISISINGFGDYPNRPEAEVLRMEEDTYFLWCQGIAVTGACLVAWTAGFVGGEATKHSTSN